MKRILIAGIGNIFMGDDAFGVEVVRALLRNPLPPEVEVRDFGIRGYDLALALAQGGDAAILVDAITRGGPPGTVCLMEPDVTQLGRMSPDAADGHSMEPVRVLQMAEALGGRPARLYLVGCEPGELDLEEGRMGLSEAVQTAVPNAVEMIHSLVGELLKPGVRTAPGIVTV